MTMTSRFHDATRQSEEMLSVTTRVISGLLNSVLDDGLHLANQCSAIGVTA